jgi:hypothetical protein
MPIEPITTIVVPKPLPCRLAELLKDWKETRDNMKKRGEEEAALAVEVCAQMLHEEVTAFFTEAKAWQAASPEERTLAVNAAKLAQASDPDGDAEERDGK